MLPPTDRRPSDVAALLANATLGLPEAVVYPDDCVHTKLSLEGMGQLGIGVGANQFGAAFGGGISLSFSDMLGNHTLATALQFNQD